MNQPLAYNRYRKHHFCRTLTIFVFFCTTLMFPPFCLQRFGFPHFVYYPYHFLQISVSCNTFTFCDRPHFSFFFMSIGAIQMRETRLPIVIPPSGPWAKLSRVKETAKKKRDKGTEEVESKKKKRERGQNNRVKGDRRRETNGKKNAYRGRYTRSLNFFMYHCFWWHLMTFCP